jgi:hypothetical protein
MKVRKYIKNRQGWYWRHDIQYNNIRYNAIKQNGSVVMLSVIYTEYRNAECHVC